MLLRGDGDERQRLIEFINRDAAGVGEMQSGGCREIGNQPRGQDIAGARPGGDPFGYALGKPDCRAVKLNFADMHALRRQDSNAIGRIA